MTVNQLMREMSALEETYWQAYYQDDPFGDHRADLRSAQITHMLHLVNSSKKSERKKLTDFLPFYRKKATVDEDVSTSILNRFKPLMDRDE